jgi:hypothetical protein
MGGGYALLYAVAGGCAVVGASATLPVKSAIERTRIGSVTGTVFSLRP